MESTFWVVAVFAFLIGVEGNMTTKNPVNGTRHLDLYTNKKQSTTGSKKEVIYSTPLHTALGSKREMDAASIQSTVENAAVEKGIEVVGGLVDKQLKLVDEAQEKARNFLKKEIKLDIVPDKGWQSEDMFIPAGYHMDAAMTGNEPAEPDDSGETPYVYPNGVGPMMMNGCWGTGYQPTDPCYEAKWKGQVCWNMIDGGAFIGVGFDGRGKYSPESRKMSIVQRTCANKQDYDGVDVPDTMNVHGIYETKATMLTFESREEYQTYLQEEAGVSGSYFTFRAGVKEAWGSSTSEARQKFMSVMKVVINRYEIFMDEVKPRDLSVSFLREFMSLPLSYSTIGSPAKFQDFIIRWGTHFITAGRFGGKLEIRKTMDATDVASKSEFAIEMETEYKGLFSSFHAKSSTEEGSSERQQTKTTSTAVEVEGGGQEIASILSDVYSPTFKSEFKEWLKSIPRYPKAFQFYMSPITDLVNFRANDLFPDESISWGCEASAAALLETTNENGEVLKYYETVGKDGAKTKHYCNYRSRQELEYAIKRKRESLARAIDIYMEEGPMSIYDFNLPACTSSKDRGQDMQQNDYWKVQRVPSWKEITQESLTFRVAFDMKEDLKGADDYIIAKNMTRMVRYKNGKWYTSEDDGSFHLYNAFPTKSGGQPSLSILGLQLKYQERDGTLNLTPHGLSVSSRVYPELSSKLARETLASVSVDIDIKAKRSASSTSPPPCNVKWSNALRFDPSETGGRCLHFTAASDGPIYVVFAGLPGDINTWYYVRIATDNVEIFKGRNLKTSTQNKNALGLGDMILLQTYFVCIIESHEYTFIEYGKSLGVATKGDIYLNAFDTARQLHVRFYSFGNGAEEMQILDARIVSRAMTETKCKGDTHQDPETGLCVQKCHVDCNPFAGCIVRQNQEEPSPRDCHECRVAMDQEEGICVPHCPPGKDLDPSKKLCVPSYEIVLRSVKKVDTMIRGIPRMSQMSICLWLRLTATINFQSGYKPYYIATYGNPGTETNNNFFLRLHPLNTNGIKFSTYIKDSGDTYFDFSELSDNLWHQVCIVWSGVTGYITRYADGKLKMTGRRAITKGFIAGGGYLYVGEGAPVEMRITDFNLWDRELTAAEVASYYEQCGAAEGNVKHWHDFYKGVSSDPERFRSPTGCRPNAAQ